mmetsp:Transcript_16792/g.46225  ORF Transcript_16792/g.46225 Transcript_16792/m.46225 type:complete len:292 (-) Transcript_16792:2081-2956(-)
MRATVPVSRIAAGATGATRHEPAKTPRCSNSWKPAKPAIHPTSALRTPAAFNAGSLAAQLQAEGEEAALAAGQLEVPLQARTLSGTASCLAQSSDWPLLQATERCCLPTPHPFEQVPHWPTSHLQPPVFTQGSVKAMDTAPGACPQPSGTGPWAGTHETLRVRSPVPHAEVHPDQSPSHSHPSVALQDCSLFGCGVRARQSSSKLPSAQDMFLVCAPTPQRTEQEDHAPASHLQPETSWHCSSLAGLLPSWSRQSDAFLLGHSTVLVRVPWPHLEEHGDHLLAFQLHFPWP